MITSDTQRGPVADDRLRPAGPFGGSVRHKYVQINTKS